MSGDSFPIVSLFCGAGGLDLGFRRQRFNVILACDASEAAVASYNRNSRRKIARVNDLSTTNVERVLAAIGKHVPAVVPVGLIGGPPCQGFSRGNVQARADDPRNLLPFRYAELLSALNARFCMSFFVFENVMGLLNPRNIVRFRAIRRAFIKAGFNVFHGELDAQDFGVPQHRRRLFVIGLNRSLFPKVTFAFPQGSGKRMTVRDAIYGLPAPVFFERGLSAAEIPFHPNHWTMQPRSPKLLNGGSTDGRSFRRLAWDEVSPTVAYGNREIHVHPDGGRRLTVLEAMLLQGFPESYQLHGNFSEQVSQVSNAVPPPISRAIARSIRRVLLAGGRS